MAEIVLRGAGVKDPQYLTPCEFCKDEDQRDECFKNKKSHCEPDYTDPECQPAVIKFEQAEWNYEKLMANSVVAELLKRGASKGEVLELLIEPVVGHLEMDNLLDGDKMSSIRELKKRIDDDNNVLNIR
ncbi:MAG: hypothetical protein LBL08_00690 [Candidatus Nomurabacteria bacterium]|jgi:hypothetical protein|nr:hypothetical protein [Candidatus Nomurabacteria bacterium]